MAQALLDLTYYKCGHCSQNFNSLAAFGKHQREVHTPKNCPKARQIKQEDQAEEIKHPVEEEETTSLLPSNDKPYLEFVLKLRLCQKCVNATKIRSGCKLQVPLCSICMQRNDFI